MIQNLKRPFFALAVIVTAFFGMSVVPMNAQAQEYSYQAGGSTFIDFGELGGFAGGSGGESTTVFDIGFNANAGSFLGCAGISLEGFMDAFANLEMVFDNFLKNLEGAFFRRILVEAFSRMPQLGALFDSMNAMGNARFEMFNESCDIGAIQGEAKELIYKRCIEAGGSDYDCNPATAQSSLFGSSPLDDAIKGISAEMEKFQEMMTNIGVPLRGTMCDNNPTQTASFCGLMSFMPQMKLCWNAGVNAGNSGAGIGGCTQTRTANAPIRPQQIFDLSRDSAYALVSTQGGIFQNAVNSGVPIDLLQNLNTQFSASGGQGDNGQPINLLSQSPNEALNARIAGKNTRPMKERFAFLDYNMGVTNFAGEDNDDEIEDFKKFLHCSNDDPTAAVKAFLEFAGQKESALAGSDITLDDVLNQEQIKLSEVLQFDNMGTLEQVALGDSTQAGKLIAAGIGCVLNHQLHVSINTYIALTQLPKSDRKAFEWAVANRAAFLTSELLLRYLKQKTLSAHAQLASGYTPSDALEKAFEATKEGAGGSMDAGCDDCETPQPVLEAIKAIAEMFENQVQALRAVRQERDSFSTISAKVYEKIQANKDAARGN